MGDSIMAGRKDASRAKIYITIVPVDGEICDAGVDIFTDRKAAEDYASMFDGMKVIEKRISVEPPEPKKVPVTVTCYGNTENWPCAEDAIRYYREAANCSDGCERDRYLTIVSKLLDGQTVVDDQWG